MVKNRIIEIDILRVVAILLMVVYHFVYDLNEFAGIDIDYESTFWFLIGKTAAFLFIFVCGISSCFSRNTTKRGLMILSFGLLISIITYIFDSKEYVRFGILHFLGISILISGFFKKVNKPSLLGLSILSVLIGVWSNYVDVSTFLLLPFGFMYTGFSTIDYYPIFPYLAVFILGILVYKTYYEKGLYLMKGKYRFNVIRSISEHSLFIYLIHQPILLGLIYICKMVWSQ